MEYCNKKDDSINRKTILETLGNSNEPLHAGDIAEKAGLEKDNQKSSQK